MVAFNSFVHIFKKQLFNTWTKLLLFFIGIGGSGRQSAAKLATFMADFDIFQIEIAKNYSIPDWRDDLKKVDLLYFSVFSFMLFFFLNRKLNPLEFDSAGRAIGKVKICFISLE